MLVVAIERDSRKTTTWTLATLCAHISYTTSTKEVDVKDEYGKVLKIIDDVAVKLKRKQPFTFLRDQEIFPVSTDIIASIAPQGLTIPRNFNNIFHKKDAEAYKFEASHYEMDAHGALLEGPDGETEKKRGIQDIFPAYGKLEEFGIDYIESKPPSWVASGSPCQRLYAALIASGSTYLRDSNMANVVSTYLLHERERRLIKGLLRMKTKQYGSVKIPQAFDVKVRKDLDMTEYTEPLRQLMSEVLTSRTKTSKDTFAYIFPDSLGQDTQALSEVAEKMANFIWDNYSDQRATTNTLQRLLQSESIWKINSPNQEVKKYFSAIKRDLRELDAVSLINQEVRETLAQFNDYGTYRAPELKYSLRFGRAARAVAEKAQEDVRAAADPLKKRTNYRYKCQQTPLLLALIKLHSAKRLLSLKTDAHIASLQNMLASSRLPELVEMAVLWLLEDSDQQDNIFLALAEALKINLVVFSSDTAYKTYLIPGSNASTTPIVCIKYNWEKCDIKGLRILGNDQHSVHDTFTAEDVFKMGLKFSNPVLSKQRRAQSTLD